MKKINPSKFFGLLLLFIGLTISGCDALESDDLEEDDTTSFRESEEVEDDEESESESRSTASENDLLIEKLNAYVDCTNNHSGNVLNNFDHYLSWVDPELGPSADQTIYGLFELYYDSSDCIEAIEAANEIDVENQVNEVAEAYADALETVVPLIEEAYTYYDRENYLDDDMAQGRIMHGPLMEAFMAMEENHYALLEAMDPLEKRVDDYLLEEYKKSGDIFSYNLQKVMMGAEDLIDLGNVSTYGEVDLEAFTTALDAYEANLNELRDYAGENQEELEAEYFSFDSMDSALEDYLIAATQLMRRVRDNTPYSSSELSLGGDNSNLVDGSPAKLVEEYNNVISRYSLL